MAMIQANPEPTHRSLQTNEAAAEDAELVDGVRAGDPIAFELIMRRHNRRLYRLARSIIRNSAEAEDVVQEAYVRAYQKIDQFIGPHGFSAWLGRIVVNEALGRLRRGGHEISLDAYLQDSDVRLIETMKSEQPNPERLAANSELRGILEEAIDRLPDAFRAVFVLRAVEGMSIAETAECLAIRPETVKTRHHRARRLLQNALGQQLDALTPSAFDFGGQHCDRIVTAVMARLATSFEDARGQANFSSTPRAGTRTADE